MRLIKLFKKMLTPVEPQWHWRPVSDPVPWDCCAGAELIGVYRGKIQRNGSYGPYEVVTIYSDGTVFAISGSALIRKLDLVPQGSQVRIVRRHDATTSSGYSMKQFDVYTRSV